MAKSKRERMKEKAARHRKGKAGENSALSPASGPSEAIRKEKMREPAETPTHLAHASTEWKQWYLAVSKQFR